MRKNILLNCCLALSILLTGCGSDPSSSSSEEKQRSTPVSEIAKTESGKTYYSVDGKPVTPIGIQVRTDLIYNVEKQDISEVERRLRLAKELGVNMVELPIRWEDTEPSKDVYDFRQVGQFMKIAADLDLYIEILLFSTNTTGYSGHVAKYIREDKETYPRYYSASSPDTVFLVQNNPNLLNREGKWLNAMMEYIRAWTDSNNKIVVSAIQIHNESDTFPRFVLSQREVLVTDKSRRLTDIEAWKETKEAYDYLGKVVKDSVYNCITRVNVAQAYKDAWTSFVPDILNLENIDIVGDDTYEETVAFTKNMLLDFCSEDNLCEDNFPHVSENDGSYKTVPSLVLAALCLGGGYMIYDLCTPEVALDSYKWDDWSILNPRTLEDKEHTPLARNILNGINKSGSDMVLTDKENIAGFNLKTNLPVMEKQQTICTTHAQFDFSTTTGAIGYAITNDKYIDMYFTSDVSLKISNVTYENVLYAGTVNNIGTFSKESEESISSDTLDLKGGIMYRLNVTGCKEKLKSTTVKNIG